MLKELKLYDERLPARKDSEEDLKWLCASLGLKSKRDKDRTTLKVFRFIIEKTRMAKTASVKEMSEYFGLTRVAVNHHLKKLKNLGLVAQGRHAAGQYELRSINLAETMHEVENDALRLFSRLKKTAADLDRSLNMPSR